MHPVWLVAAVVVVGVATGAASQCMDRPSCQEVNSESSMLECIQFCHSLLTAGAPLTPGDAHLYPLPPSNPESPPLLSLLSVSPPSAKRSYPMEHFRWGKPVGRKRRPVKVYASNGGKEESGETRRRQTAEEEELVVAEEEKEQLPGELHSMKDDTYKMTHFRWNRPPASKRYGGFMKSWDARSQRPLLTLFRNVINKDGQEQEEEREQTEESAEENSEKNV